MSVTTLAARGDCSLDLVDDDMGVHLDFRQLGEIRSRISFPSEVDRQGGSPANFVKLMLNYLYGTRVRLFARFEGQMLDWIPDQGYTCLTGVDTAKQTSDVWMSDTELREVCSTLVAHYHLVGIKLPAAVAA
jgi:hypothetical protein